jgi:hypothetical protein
MNNIPPYGVAIHEAVVSGDLQKMKAAEAAAALYLKEHGNISAALESLRMEIAKLERKL